MVTSSDRRTAPLEGEGRRRRRRGGVDDGQSRPGEVAKPDDLTFRPVSKRNLADFETFFSARGAPKYCWCMVWRRSAAEAKENDPASRKRQMMKRIGEGTPVGLLAYDGKAPVAWVSIAPRDTYRALGGPEAKRGENIWSLACFFVPRRLRRQGMTRRLIGAAVDYARKEGATIVEAYPVEPDAPSYRFMGFVPVFAEAGFAEVARAGARRHVMRLSLL
jgi:predicted GNAT family acetyltransferase